MSLLEDNLKSGSSSSLVEKILEQGQRLRNSMVQAVLNYDPFNTEILNSYNSPRSNLEVNKVDTATCDTNVGSKNVTSRQNNDVIRVQRYLNGEDMCVNEEMKALETLRSMSPNSLIQSTSCVKSTCHFKDSCDICNEYEHKMFVESIPSTSSLNTHTYHQKQVNQKSTHHYTVPENASQVNKNYIHDLHNIHEKLPRVKLHDKPEKRQEIVQKSSKLSAVKETFQENKKILKLVDSIKITVYSLKLNSAGNRKVMATENYKPYLSSVNTYFVEFTLPDILTRNIPKSRAKVNSGLLPDKTTRFCSKKLQSESVYFKQDSVHLISNVNMVDLSSVHVEFRISYRSIKQRGALLVGKAAFNLGYLATTQFFTGEQELVIKGENSPVTLGTLKVSVQFGCDKLYFGREFIEAVTCSKENKNLSETDSIHKLSDNELPVKPKSEKILVATNENVTQPDNKNTDKASTLENKTHVAKSDDDTLLLYALIHISEVRLLTKSLNSYIVCRGFSRDDTVTSKTVYNDFKPMFNLYQIIPVLLDEDFISRLRDNYIIVEVWEKTEDASEKLIGLSKLPTHQLYVAYRNPAIVKHLCKNPNPVIGVDWWEPITCPLTSTETGQLRSLVALGSSAQIETLELSRKIKHSTEKPPEIKSHSSLSLHSDYHKQQPVVHFELLDKSGQATSKQSFDRNYSRFERPERISRTTSYDRTLNRDSGDYISKESDDYISHPRRTDRTTTTSNIDQNSTFDKADDYHSLETARVSSRDEFRDRRHTTNNRNSEKSERVILVSDKYVQQPEVEISPSVTSVDKILNCNQKVDAFTQSEAPEMEPEPTNAQFTQRDFLNSFLEQLLTARDLNHKNTHVENSTNTENSTQNTSLTQQNTSRSTDKNTDKYTDRNSDKNTGKNTDKSTGKSTDRNTDRKPLSMGSDPNMNKSPALPTFPQNSIINSASSVRNTSDLLESLQKALGKNNVDNVDNEEVDSFKAHIVIENALHLPSRKKCKSKRNKTKSPKNEEILPSTYVTFKGMSERDYKITSIIPKSTSPRWDFRCDMQLPSDLLLNNQKRLIFKVWRKANGPSLQPNFQTDIVLGFAALDLTVLLSGLPNVQGWFNIVDFSSKCNGQIKINVTPLENLSKFNEYKRSYVPEKLRSPPAAEKPETSQELTDDSIPSELLSRALKRKFTELDEITQRLRQRLTAVTNDDSSNDDFAEEFEKDLNTICVETEPFNFSEERISVDEDGEVATSSRNDLLSSFEPLINLNSDHCSSATSEVNIPTVQENLTKLDTHLTEGKLKIDSLLEKLSLLTADNDNKTADNKTADNKTDRSFSSRYVSGCSINHEPETGINNQLFKDITGNLDTDLIFNPNLFQQMFTASLDSTPRLDSLEFMSSVHCTTLKNLVQDSTSSGSSKDIQSISSSSLSDTNITRQAPDGAGNISND